MIYVSYNTPSYAQDTRVHKIPELIRIPIRKTKSNPTKKPASFLSALQQNWHTTFSYVSARVQIPNDPGSSYHNVKGGIAHVRWKAQNGWGVDGSYFFAQEQVNFVPKPASIYETQEPNNNEQSGIYTYNNNVSLNAPEQSGERTLGWHHATALGITYTHLNHTKSYALHLALGGLYRWTPSAQKFSFQPQQSSQVISTIFDHSLAQAPGLHVWGMFRWTQHWYWIQGQVGGLQPDVSVWSQYNLMAGINLGRLQLGSGWAWDTGTHSIPQSHGAQFLVQVPLSAAIYLRASAWVRRPPFDDSIITIGLRWTGETESPELDPPQKDSSSNRPNHDQLTPFDPTPLNPMQPNQKPTDRPLSPLNPTPTPL